MKLLPKLNLNQQGYTEQRYTQTMSSFSNTQRKSQGIIQLGNQTYRDPYQIMNKKPLLSDRFGPKQVKSLNTSLLGLQIGIGINADDKTVVQPKLVKDRSEWNSNIYLLQKKKKKKKYKPIKNYLKIRFPVHRNIDYVEKHNKGFENKGNIDLFKHYYRMYLKNKWIVIQTKKNKIKAQLNLREVGERRGHVIISQQQSNCIFIMIQQEIIMNLQYFPPHNKTTETQEEEVTETIPIRLKNFILNKNLDDMKLYQNLINLYEQKVDPIEIISKRDQQQQQDDLKQTLTHKVFINIDHIKHDPNLDRPDELYQLEEVFIGRIMDLICKKGITAMPYFDYMTFRSIVEERMNGLNNLKDSQVLEKLLHVRKHMSKQSHQEINFQEQVTPTKEIQLQQSNPQTDRFSSQYTQVEQSQIHQQIMNNKSNNKTIISLKKNELDRQIIQNNIKSSQNIIKTNQQDVQEVRLAARSIGMENELSNLMNETPSLEQSVRLRIMVKKIMSINKKQGKDELIHIENSSIIDYKNSIVDNAENDEQSLIEEQGVNRRISIQMMSGINSVPNTDDIIERQIGRNRSLHFSQHDNSTLNDLKKLYSMKEILQKQNSDNIESSSEQVQAGISGKSSFYINSSPKIQRNSVTKVGGTLFVSSNNLVEKNVQFKLNTKKMKIQVVKYEEKDSELLFLESLLEGHKKANQKLFSKVQSQEVIDLEEEDNDDQVQIEEEKVVTQFFRAEGMLQHKFKPSTELENDERDLRIGGYLKNNNNQKTGQQSNQKLSQEDNNQKKIDKKQFNWQKQDINLQTELIEDQQSQIDYESSRPSRSKREPSSGTQSKSNSRHFSYGQDQEQFTPQRKKSFLHKKQIIQNKLAIKSKNINENKNQTQSDEYSEELNQQEDSSKPLSSYLKRKETNMYQSPSNANKDSQLKQIVEEGDTNQNRTDKTQIRSTKRIRKNSIKRFKQWKEEDNLTQQDQESMNSEDQDDNTDQEDNDNVSNENKIQDGYKYIRKDRNKEESIENFSNQIVNDQIRGKQAQVKIKYSPKQIPLIKVTSNNTSNNDQLLGGVKQQQDIPRGRNLAQQRSNRNNQINKRFKQEGTIENSESSSQSESSSSEQSQEQSEEKNARRNKRGEQQKSGQLKVNSQRGIPMSKRNIVSKLQETEREQNGSDNLVLVPEKRRKQFTRKKLNHGSSEEGQNDENNISGTDMKRSGFKTNKKVANEIFNSKGNSQTKKGGRKSDTESGQKYQEKLAQDKIREKEANSQAQLQKQKQQLTSLKDQLAKLISQNYNTSTIKEKIEQMITQIEALGSLDDEIKQTILLYRQRLIQISQVQAQSYQFKDSLFVGQDCDEAVKNLFKTKFKFKDYEDRNLKFMDNFSYKKDQQLPTSKQFNYEDNNDVGSNWQNEDYHLRRDHFNQDTLMLKKLTVHQQDEDLKICQSKIDYIKLKTIQAQTHSAPKEVALENIMKNGKKKVAIGELKRDNKISYKKIIQLQENSQDYAQEIQTIRQFMLQRLKLIQVEYPNKWDKIKQRQFEIEMDEKANYYYIQKYLPHLLIIQEKSLFNVNTLRMADKVFNKTRQMNQTHKQEMNKFFN